MYPVLLINGRPDPVYIRGKCPDCGDDLVSILEYRMGEGYLLSWVCFSALLRVDNGNTPTCTYKKVL